jgi:hypothetical protein
MLTTRLLEPLPYLALNLKFHHCLRCEVCGSSDSECPGLLASDAVLLVVYVVKCARCVVHTYQYHSTVSQ